MFAERLLHEVVLHRRSFSAAQAQEWARGLLASVHRGLCAMRGHDVILHLEPRRLSVRCVDCGWESRGWMIDRPRFVYTSDRPVRRDFRAHAEPPRAPSATVTGDVSGFVDPSVRDSSERAIRMAPRTILTAS